MGFLSLAVVGLFLRAVLDCWCIGCVLTMLLPYHDHEVDLNGNGKVSSAEATEIFAAMLVSTQVG